MHGDLRKPAKGTALLERKRRTRAKATADRAGSLAVKARSGGRCEVFEWHPDVRVLLSASWRCHQIATQVHHLLSGNGVRGRGESARAERKLHVCAQHHNEIHARRLERIGGVVPHWTDSYRRVR